MKSGLSSIADRALERLHESSTVNWIIKSDVARNDARVADGGFANARFNSSLNYYLGSLQVGHAADSLNSYCQSILAAILEADQSLWDQLPNVLKKQSFEESVYLLAHHRGQDVAVREFIRDKIQCFWPFESEIVSKLRNKFVHQNGFDPNHEVQEEINSANGRWSPLTPPELQPGVIPVRYINSDWLDADFDLGNWACAHIRSHIHGMDQNLTSRYSVPRERWRPRPIRRVYGNSQNMPSSEPPKSMSTPTETTHSKVKPEIKQSPVQSLAPMPTEKEIQCSKHHYALKDEILNFFREYTSEAAILIRGQHCSMAGSILGHTIRGHDWSLEFDLSPKDDLSKSDFERVCVRLRERDFDPFITAWSTHGQMRDFIVSDLTDEVKDYLRDLIDKAITV